MHLAVELYGSVIGHLDGRARDFDFSVSTEGIERFGAASRALSVAVPLLRHSQRRYATRRRAWFSGLLPEGNQYDYLLAQARLPRGNIPAFLARYGRDIAGALQIWDTTDPDEPPIPLTRPVTDEQVRALLQDPVTAPLGNAPIGGKSSLTGVQPKIVLVRTAAGWARAEGGYPTTHILKPQLSGVRSSMIFDEEYGWRLAQTLGLADYAASIEAIDGLATLVVERYDRKDGRRVHQEDLAQALGAVGNEKYQEYGGKVSLARIAKTVRDHCEPDQMGSLARLVILNSALGNLDAHAKNFSLLHPTDGSVRLAPAYDIVPQTHLPGIDGRLALSVGGTYRHADLTIADLEQELAAWGLRNPRSFVAETLEQIRVAAITHDPLDGAHVELKSDVMRFTENLATGKAAGAS